MNTHDYIDTNEADFFGPVTITTPELFAELEAEHEAHTLCEGLAIQGGGRASAFVGHNTNELAAIGAALVMASVFGRSIGPFATRRQGNALVLAHWHSLLCVEHNGCVALIEDEHELLQNETSEQALAARLIELVRSTGAGLLIITPDAAFRDRLPSALLRVSCATGIPVVLLAKPTTTARHLSDWEIGIDDVLPEDLSHPLHDSYLLRGARHTRRLVNLGAMDRARIDPLPISFCGSCCGDPVNPINDLAGTRHGTLGDAGERSVQLAIQRAFVDDFKS